MNKVLRIWFWWSYWCRLKPPRFNRSIWFIEINGFALQQIDLKRLQSSFFFMYRSDCTKVQRGDALSNEHKISMTKSRYFRLKYEWKGSNDGRKKISPKKLLFRYYISNLFSLFFHTFCQLFLRWIVRLANKMCVYAKSSELLCPFPLESLLFGLSIHLFAKTSN